MTPVTLNYTQVVGRKFDRDYTEAEIELNLAGDGYVRGDCGFPMDEYITFTRELMPKHAIHEPTGELVRLYICPVTVDVIYAAFDALEKLIRPQVPLPPHMMVDPFTGISCLRPDMAKMFSFDPEMLSPSHKELYYEREAAKRGEVYHKTKESVEPQVTERDHNNIADFMKQFISCASKCATMDDEEDQLQVFAEKRDSSVSGDFKYAPLSMDSGVVDTGSVFEVDSVVPSVFDGDVKALPNLPEDTFDFVQIPDWPECQSGCARFYGMPVCNAVCCIQDSRQAEMLLVTDVDLSKFQFKQYAAMVNQAVHRENEALNGHDPGGWHGAHTAFREQLCDNYSACALVATADECEVPYCDTGGMSYAEYTCRLSDHELEAVALLPIKQFGNRCHERDRLLGRQAVVGSNIKCRASVACVRQYALPVWCNDAVVAVATRVVDDVLIPSLIVGVGTRVAGYGDVPYTDRRGQAPITLRRYRTIDSGVGLPRCRVPEIGEKVVVMVHFEMCMVPVGPYTVKAIGSGYCLDHAWLNPTSLGAPAVSVGDGCIVGVVYPDATGLYGAVLWCEPDLLH